MVPAFSYPTALGRPDSRFAHPFSQLIGNGHRRRFLQHLLMTPLNRTVPFSKMNHVSEAVCQNLELNVSGLLHDTVSIYMVSSENPLMDSI